LVFSRPRRRSPHQVFKTSIIVPDRERLSSIIEAALRSSPGVRVRRPSPHRVVRVVALAEASMTRHRDAAASVSPPRFRHQGDVPDAELRPRCDSASGSLQPPKRPSLSLHSATVRLHFGFAPAAETTFALPPLGHGATSLRVRSSRRNDLCSPSARPRCAASLRWAFIPA